MSGRIAPARAPLTVTFDGTEITASSGEPAAVALVAAGHLALARSPKFHRPRGPSCMRAACDGCLARVDGVPNVMTCLIEVREGMTIDSQNTLGPREMDLLRMTDWFFPQGMNHHELFAGVPGVQQVMQAFARRVAGLGRIPAEAAPERPACRRDADVVVVGSGPAGLATARELARRGRSVELLDDALVPGGSLRALAAPNFAGAVRWREIFQVATDSQVSIRPSTTAGAVYGDDLLIVGPEGAEVVSARDVILAPGAHDGILPFEGNDIPGVMSARAALLFLSFGVTVGERIVVVVPPEGAPFGVAYAEELERLVPHASITVVHGVPLKVSGTARVREVTVQEAGKGPVSLRADALIVDAPRAPAYELAEQAGASLEHRPTGFFTQTDHGKIRDRFWAVGEVVGTPLTPEALLEEAHLLAKRF